MRERMLLLLQKLFSILIAFLVFSVCSENSSNDIDVILLEDIEFVTIPSGTFQMGSTDGWDDEQPVHTVSISPFLMSVYEVTNSQYCKFLNEVGNQMEGGASWLHIGSYNCKIEYIDNIYSPISGFDKHPVVEVSWYGARAFCKHYGWRLPTEAEWEYAARGGLEQKKYPWGAKDPSCTPGAKNGANYNDCGHRGTVEIDRYGGNGYGLYQVAGNVSEYCGDWYDEDYYNDSPTTNPQGPSNGKHIVLRGGSWELSETSLRCADRSWIWQTETYRNYGFRCAFSAR